MNCCFCDEYSNPDNNQYYNLYGRSHGLKSRIVMETANWYAVPTIGCLTPGYLLLVCKRHYTCLASLSADLYQEMMGLKSELESIIARKTGKQCLLFEHGTHGPEFVGANSVDHIHLHLAPFEKPAWKGIAEKHGIFNSLTFSDFDSLFEFWKSNAPKSYLVFQDLDKSVNYVADASVFPSQFFRQCLAALLGGLQWDWRKEGHIQNLVETYKMLKDGMRKGEPFGEGAHFPSGQSQFQLNYSEVDKS